MMTGYWILASIWRRRILRLDPWTPHVESIGKPSSWLETEFYESRPTRSTFPLVPSAPFSSGTLVTSFPGYTVPCWRSQRRIVTRPTNGDSKFGRIVNEAILEFQAKAQSDASLASDSGSCCIRSGKYAEYESQHISLLPWHICMLHTPKWIRKAFQFQISVTCYAINLILSLRTIWVRVWANSGFLKIKNQNVYL
jgi:hypothetical protein